MTLTGRQIDEIRNLIHGRVMTDMAVSKFTSFKIGGPADLVAEPVDYAELRKLLLYLDQEKINRVVLGAGTNVLFHDKGFRGVVIRTAASILLDSRKRVGLLQGDAGCGGSPTPRSVKSVHTGT